MISQLLYFRCQSRCQLEPGGSNKLTAVLTLHQTPGALPRANLPYALHDVLEQLAINLGHADDVSPSEAACQGRTERTAGKDGMDWPFSSGGVAKGTMGDEANGPCTSGGFWASPS